MKRIGGRRKKKQPRSSLEAAFQESKHVKLEDLVNKAIQMQLKAHV
jgi:hypothetical protein